MKTITVTKEQLEHGIKVNRETLMVTCFVCKRETRDASCCKNAATLFEFWKKATI